MESKTLVNQILTLLFKVPVEGFNKTEKVSEWRDRFSHCLHAYLGNEDNVNHPFIQTQLLLVTVYQMITLISEYIKRQFDMLY